MVYFVLVLGLLLGGSLWLDRKGTLVAATVTGKLEEVSVHASPQAAWTRWYRVGVEFNAERGGLGMATVSVPQERFDALRKGDTLAIRYLPAFPLLGRTADRSTAQVLREAGSQLVGDPFLTRFVVWLLAGGLALWLMARVATAAVFVIGAAWIAAAFPLLFPAPAPIRLGPAETTAKVEAVRVVAKAPEAGPGRRRRYSSESSRRLAMPYQVVQLRLGVPGRPDSVLAVDAVDSASVPGLAVGTVLPVHYDPRAPREARLRVGQRTYRERNRYHLRVPVLGVGLLGILAAWGWRARTRRKGNGRSAPEMAHSRSAV
jgi:hypothetical protein